MSENNGVLKSNDTSLADEFRSAKEYRFPHLSLCILETFFENDSNNKVSVRPIIEKYADSVGLRIDVSARNEEKFAEQTVSEFYKSIVEMPAKKRESIFGVDNLSALTILLEIFIKSKLELIDDVIWTANEQSKVNLFRSKLEQKGYLKKFNDAIMKDIFGKDVEMKKKKNDAMVGVKTPLINVKAEVITTSNRKIQLFPALYGAFNYGLMSVLGILSALVFGIISLGQFSQFSSLTSLQCHSLTSSSSSAVASTAIDGTMKSICDGNSANLIFAYLILILAIAGAVVAVVGLIKFLRIILHNQFANVHNAFELAHFTLTNK